MGWDGVTCDKTTAHVIGLDLFCNCLYGTIHPNSSLFNLVHLQHLDLSWNNFNHSQILPSFGRFTNLTHLQLSGSYLSGPIQSSEEEVWQGNNFSNSIFHLQKLQELWLGGNRELTAKLPSFINGTPLPPLSETLGNYDCHLATGDLMVLNLQSNNFSGTIPQTFGYASWLQELDISSNGLQGVLPRSLANCMNLEILNLGHNFIEDAFPFWLENLPQLKVIVLRDNKFHGPIEQPRKRLAFTNLHIIDMSHNEFTGTLPSKLFESMRSMMMDDEDKSSLKYMGNDYGYFSVTIMNKGLKMELVRIITILKVTDFSHNKFDGNIPISIGRLKALHVLNFSRNGLTRLIPVSLGDLINFESLDLSQNMLSGKIP
ncbi:hypothetical protein ACSBR1_020958 [Camellia fascicularis]